MIAQYRDVLLAEPSELAALQSDLRSDQAKMVANFLLHPEELNRELSTATSDQELEALDQAKSIQSWVEQNKIPA